MDKSLFEQLATRAERQSYSPGEIIVKQGSRAEAFFVLVEGSVEISRTSGGGAHGQLSSMTAPAYFGEIGLMEEGRRTATVRSAADSVVEVLVISRVDFCEFVDASEMMADEIAGLMQQYRIKDSLATALNAAPDTLLSEFTARARLVTYTQGDQIICQGDPAEYFYILTRGRVEVLHQRDDGRTYLINFHEPGEYFGEIGLLQNRPRSATVRAADETIEVLAFDRAAFQELLSDSTETEVAIAREVAERLARLTDTRDS